MAKLIELRDVYKIYGEGLESEVRALDGVSLDIEKGEFVAVVGQSGSGKSTMMNVLGCLDIPTRGTYRLDGVDVRELSDKELSRIRNKQIGFIFQQYNLIQSLTVLENGSEQTLKPDLLYKIVETKAPQNYQKDDTPHYVLFHKSNETPQTAFDTATGKETVIDEGKTIQFDDVQVGNAAQTTTAQYTNRYSNLTVSKLWLDADTRQPVEPAVNSIHIKVWQYTDNAEKKTLFAEADLTADNNWTWSESGDKLPLTDAQGNAYHYLVEEETTGNWNVYISNNGVQTGNITVQNYVYTGYELPSTGGMGTAPFGVLGGALAAAAALLLVRKRKQDEEE